MTTATTGIEFQDEFLRSLQHLKCEAPTGTSPAAQVGADRPAAVNGADRPAERK